MQYTIIIILYYYYYYYFEWRREAIGRVEISKLEEKKNWVQLSSSYCSNRTAPHRIASHRINNKWNAILALFPIILSWLRSCCLVCRVVFSIFLLHLYNGYTLHNMNMNKCIWLLSTLHIHICMIFFCTNRRTEKDTPVYVYANFAYVFVWMHIAHIYKLVHQHSASTWVIITTKWCEKKCELKA